MRCPLIVVRNGRYASAASWPMPGDRQAGIGDRGERVLQADGSVVERWLFAMFTTSTPAAFSAENDAAGDRKW